ncbi:MAG TPA: hypothetical protein VH062_22185 [Polyangiaceae bacterium]|nr:hypothetical protein [Polyangiaceae bacterium]
MVISAGPAPLPAPVPDHPPLADWRLIGWLGGFAQLDGSKYGGIENGVAFQYRYRWFVGGPLVAASAEPLSASSYTVAATAGVGTRLGKQVRAQVLGVFGAHFHQNVGYELLGNDNGADGTVPFAGARASMGYLFGKRFAHFELGAFVELDDDLTRRHITYEVDGASVTHVVGTSTVAFGIELGGSHDVF